MHKCWLCWSQWIRIFNHQVAFSLFQTLIIFNLMVMAFIMSITTSLIWNICNWLISSISYLESTLPDSSYILPLSSLSGLLAPPLLLFFMCPREGLYCLLTWSIWKMQNNNLSNPSESQGPATSESNNLPTARPSSGSAFAKLKSCRGFKDNELMKKSILMRGESGKTAAITKADMEQLAQNRGNAMLRYKEKKKTRRYVLSFP